MISITIEKLTKRFGEAVALNGIDLRIEPGEIFFLLGPSGCGKTTLLRSIAGFYLPEGGRILFDQDDVTRLPPHRRDTGMMFQSYALWPHMTVAKNVAFGLEERKIPKPEIATRVAEALASVRMENYASRHIHQLSGGQQQRVALARALVIRPRCLLLDEPLSNLDAKLRLEMRSEIRRVCKEFGLTAIYVTHDQKEALSIADRLAILEGGTLQQIGAPGEVYRRPLTRGVADFIGETNFLPAKIISARAGAAELEIDGAKFTGVISRADWTPAPGTAVTVSIRPETWKLQPEPAAQNSLAGKIEESIYLGEVAQYQFQTTAGLLKISELNPRWVHAAQAQALHASVAAEDVVVLRD